jgi:hypothetical protein
MMMPSLPGKLDGSGVSFTCNDGLFAAVLFLSQQTSHQQPASSTFLSEQISTRHQPPAKRTGWNFQTIKSFLVNHVRKALSIFYLLCHFCFSFVFVSGHLIDSS